MRLNKHLQDVLFILAVSNSVVNPLIYGRYSIPCCRNFFQGNKQQLQREQLLLQQQQMAFLAQRERNSRGDSLHRHSAGDKKLRLPATLNQVKVVSIGTLGTI